MKRFLITIIAVTLFVLNLKALSIVSDATATIDTVSILLRHANYSSQQKKYDDAINYCTEALQVLKDTNDTKEAFLASNEQDVEAVARQVIRKGAKIKSIRRVSTWMTVAASVICIVWLGIAYNDYKNTTSLGEEYGRADIFGSDDFSIARGADTSSEILMKLEKLFTSVRNGDDLENTIHDLSLCWELSTMETFNEYTNYSADIGWNLAIAYLKDNN